MFRDTMIMTMPVAMIAIEALWTDRFQRLRAVRKVPCPAMLNPTQMMTSAPIMPISRVSTSSMARRARAGARALRTASVVRRMNEAGRPSVVAWPADSENPMVPRSG